MTYSEWSDQKRKKKEEEERKKAQESSTSSADWTNKAKDYQTYAEWSDAKHGVTEEEKDSALAWRDDEIAPVKEEKRTWFTKGAFEDGYQAGDVTKTILGSVEDVASDLYSGVLGIGEKAIDTVAYGVGGIGKLFGADEFAEDTKDFIEKDIIDEEGIAKVITGVTGGYAADFVADKILGIGKVRDEENSVFGEKMDSVVQSGGQLAGTLALQSVGVPAWLTMGATAFGSEVESAFQQDASYGEAGISGAVSAVSEVVFEKISGGIKFGGGTADDILQNFLKNNITNKVGRTIAKYTTDMAGEGLEEVLTEGVSAIGRKLTYLSDKEWNEVISSEDLFDSFIGGALLGGVVGGGKIAKSAKTGRDFVTDLTANEEKVVRKVHEDEIAKQEANGDKLSSKEKNDLWDKIVKKMERGYIDTDTIESVLGGESYESYKSATDSENALVEQEKALQDEYKALNAKKLNDMTGEEQDRREELKKILPELQAKIKANEQNGNTKQLKSQLSNSVRDMVGKDRLVESYNEKVRATQDYVADLDRFKGTKHEDAAKKTIENAIKAGANNTNAVHDIVDFAADLSSETGRVFDFGDDEQIKNAFIELETKKIAKLESVKNLTNEEVEKLAKMKDLVAKVQSGEVVLNGSFDGSNGIMLNLDSANPLNSVIGHEITHTTEKSKHYNKLRDSLFAYAKTKGVDIDAELEMKALEYEGVKGTTPEAELVADLVGEYLFTDSDYVKQLTTDNRNIAQRIYDEIKYFLTKAREGSKEERELLKVKHEFEKAFRESAEISNEAKKVAYSFGVTQEDINNYVDAAYENENDADYKKYAEVSERLLNDVSGDIDLNGYAHAMRDNDIRHIRNSHGENTPEKYPITKEDMKNIPWLVENYDKVLVVKRNDGRVGLVYVKTAQDGLVYYLEQVTTRYGNEPLLINKQMIKTGIDDIPKLPGLKDAITKKQSEIEFLDDLKKAPKVYAQSVYQSHSIDRVAEKEESVNNEFDESGKSANKSGVEYDEASESYSPVKYSFSSWNKSDYVTERQKAAKEMAKTLGVTEFKATKYIDDVNSVAKIIADNQERLAYEPTPNRSAFVSNAEYGGSIDFSTICKKRRLFTGTFEAIQNALPNTALTADEVLEIRKMMKDKGYEVSCGLCYVEGSRTNMGQYTKQFIERYKATNPEYVPNMAEMNTATGQEKIRKEHPEVYEAYEYFMNHYGRLAPTDKALFASQQKPKMYQMATEYKGEILDNFGKKKGSVEAKNKNGGLRLQSFSDFEIIHLIDSMQVIMDMSRVGLAGQAYTKVPDFAWALGDTGLKINLSLIAKGVDDNGRLVLDEVEGMKESDAMALRDRYSDNVGTILVAFNDEQLKAAMADERIDYIIPYHRSQWKTDQYAAMGLPENTKDYTPYQNESYIEAVYNKSGKKQRPDNYMPNTYWDFNKSGKENAEAYLKMCAENNRKPKFSHLLIDNKDGSYSLQPDGSTDGYWKTLIDFKMYNNEGQGVPQNPVVPNFNMEEAQRMLNEYKGGHAKFPVARDIVDEFVSKHPDSIAPTETAYSLSNANKELSPYSNYVFYGKDFKVKPSDDIAPTQGGGTNVPTTEDIAPVADAPFPDEISPMTEEEANAVQDAKAQADAKLEGDPKTRKQLHSNIINDFKATFSSGGYDLDDVLKSAKNLSTWSTVDNTPQRVMEKALGYKEGQILADLTVNKVAQNETEGIKWLNSYLDRKEGQVAKISKQYGIKPASDESAAAQMYAEGFYVNDNNDIIAYGDAELAKDFPDVNVRNNIKRLASDPRIRRIYDETLDLINASRRRNAYPEIQRLDNYYLHFRAMTDTFSQLGLPFNPNDIRAKDLPTDLNGVTADLKPGQPYFASAMHRKGKRTSFDLLGGLERYLTAAKNQIYHIDDIQNLRALRNYIADTYGQANGLEGIDELTEAEAQERMEQVFGSHLSTFAKFLNEEANVLAGKTALIDRGLEGVIGRRGMTFLDTVNKQTGSNMVGFNISSSLTNFIPVAQTFAKTNKFDFTKAFAQTVSNKIGSIFGKGDNFAENSPVIIRRKGADRFYRTPFQKVADTGYVLMSAVDDISTELIARTKFNEFTRKGMSEQQAHFETDKWVSRLMGDRSLGQMPQLYNSKTLGIITKFQLEVRNQLDAQFYDTIQEAKVSNEDIENTLARNAKTAAKVTSTFVQLAVVQHLFGKAFESVAGYNPAFDIIGVLATMFGFDDDEESEDTALDNVEQGFLELLEDLPYTSTFTGGRVPMSAALPITELVKGTDSYGNEKSRVETFLEAAPYYVLPTGYGQIKKTSQGLGMFNLDDEHPVAGSYTDSGNLRYPVEDTIGNRIQAGIFGQYANENAREYFDNGYAPLKEKQIEEYMDVELPIADYWKYREGLSGLTKLEEKAEYINSLDIDDWQKNLLINNIADRKEDIDMSNYDDYGSFEEFDYAQKKPEKYAFAKSVGGYSAYQTYSDDLKDIKADKDEDGKSITGSRKEKVLNYINNLDADYETKIILFKSEYPSDDTYNAEIINYLNNREDLTYDELVAIYTELGFDVKDGYVYWD